MKRTWQNHPTNISTALTIAVVQICVLLTSCGTTRYLKPYEELLYSNTYDITMADSSALPPEIENVFSDHKHYSTQTPNYKILGMRPSLWIYNLASPNHNNIIARTLRKQGSAPVVYDENASVRTTQQLQSLMFSKGCFGSTATFDTTHVKSRNVRVNYHIVAQPRHKIDEVKFFAATHEVDSLLQNDWKQQSLLRVGDYYDQDVLAKEREDLAEYLQNRGYYLAKKELVTYQIDTTYDSRDLSVWLTVNNPKVQNSDKQLDETPLQRFHIANIYIYPNSGSDMEPYDTLSVPHIHNNRHTEYKFLSSSPMAISPQTISNNMMLFDGMLYRPRQLTRTYNSLRNLRNFKYINIEMSPSPLSRDTMPLLDARVRLMNNTRSTITASLELNNVSSIATNGETTQRGNFGLEGSLSYQNRNLFGGAEYFKSELSLLVELPKLIFRQDNTELKFHDIFNTFETGLDLSLDLPKFLLPFGNGFAWQSIRPHTVISLGGSYQYRTYFERLMASTSYGYTWSKNRSVSHQALPLELTFVRFIDISDSFRQRIDTNSDTRLKYLYSNHFIMDMRYDYIHNTQRFNTRENFSYYHLSLESAGNLLNCITRLTNAEVDDQGILQLFGVPFSQYIRMNSEWKHYFYIGKKQTLVLRTIIGLGIPYSNSKAMPYEKGFYGGGPNTMRAWQLRYLGPGLYHRDDDLLFERVGDMTLVANVEHRFPIFGKFEGAVFADMGNVWLLRPSEEFVDGEISVDNFFKGIAIGTGVGLRLNISIITLRLDAAIPVYDPGYIESHRWRPAYWKPSQIVASFGIDYPF